MSIGKPLCLSAALCMFAVCTVAGAQDTVTVAQMIDYVKRRLVMEDKPVSLRRLLHNTHTERALICMFLAMLELVRLQAVLLHQPNLQGDILIKKTEAFDQVFADQAQARDDWR